VDLSQDVVNIVYGRRGARLRLSDDDARRRGVGSCDKLELAGKGIEVAEREEGTGEVDEPQERRHPWHCKSVDSDISFAWIDDKEDQTYRKSCNSQTPVTP